MLNRLHELLRKKFREKVLNIEQVERTDINYQN